MSGGFLFDRQRILHALVDLKYGDDDKLADYLVGQLARRPGRLEEVGSVQFVREELGRVIVASAFFGETVETGDAVDMECPTPSAAIEWINEVSLRPDFIVGMIRDRRTGLVTKVEPKRQEPRPDLDRACGVSGITSTDTHLFYREKSMLIAGDEERMFDREIATFRRGMATKVEPKPQLRVFKMDDIEWWFATSLEEAKARYRSDYGFKPDDDQYELEDARELTDAELDSLTFRDQDDCEIPVGLPISFRTRLEQEKHDLEARYFCGTEW